jgi:hypothetical protein
MSSTSLAKGEFSFAVRSEAGQEQETVRIAFENFIALVSSIQNVVNGTGI